MRRTDRSISDLLTDTALPGALLSPFIYRVTDWTAGLTIPAGARSVTFLLITAADTSNPPTVNLLPVTTQLSYTSEFPGDALPAFVIEGQPGDDLLAIGVTTGSVTPPPPPTSTITDESGATITDELGQPLLPET